MDISRHDRVDHIFSGDPALDRKRKGFKAAWEAAGDSGDVAGLKPYFRDGFTPAVWHLRRLTREQYMAVVGSPKHRQTMEALAYGLEGVDGLTNGGRPIRLQHEKTETGERLCRESLDEIDIPALMLELGLRIIILSDLRPTTGQG